MRSLVTRPARHKRSSTLLRASLPRLEPKFITPFISTPQLRALALTPLSADGATRLRLRPSLNASPEKLWVPTITVPLKAAVSYTHNKATTGQKTDANGLLNGRHALYAPALTGCL